MTLLFSVLTQAIVFLPLALAITISYHVLRATDMTLDGSFVMGAGIFALLVTHEFSPLSAAVAALMTGAACGGLTASIQRGGRVDPLLAGVLAVFMLSSLSLIIMGKPNINLLNETTLVSSAFSQSEILGWMVVSLYVLVLCLVAYALMSSRFGLTLRAMGDNPVLLSRLGKSIETYRVMGFALTNLLAAGAGMLTAQTAGYADINMGFGMTLTAVGAIILGEQLVRRLKPAAMFRMRLEFIACLAGVLLYFFAMNILLRLDINPVSLKLALGAMLVVFLRTAMRTQSIEKKL